MKKTTRSRFYDRLTTTQIAELDDRPVYIHPEFVTINPATGEANILIDERLNFYKFDNILEFLDANKILYTVKAKLCEFTNSPPEVRRFIFIDNRNFSNYEFLI